MITVRGIFKPAILKLLSLAIIAPLVALVPATEASAMDCTSAVIDLDGDGWGYENSSSCRMPSGHPICSATATITSGDWGYENGRSCLNTGGAPHCSAAAVVTGGGWGWENNQSCRVIVAASGASSTSSANSGNSGSSGASSSGAYTGSAPFCSGNAFNNGDGWGWENNQSCRFGSGSSSQSATTGSAASASSGSAANSAPQCSEFAADGGNGWGFEFGRSCVWNGVQPNNGRNDVQVAPAPVTVSAIGFQDGDPICLTDASDGNADGFGYENNRSCRVVAGRTATSSDPLLNTRWCQPWAEISYDDYVLQNNTWNSSDVYSNNWSQCIELTGGRGNYVAEWDYNWLARDEGNEFSVKSYPQVYYGRKTGNSQSGTPEKLGLPVNVNEMPEYKVRYRYSETGTAERNVALESFFHTSCEAEEWNKHFEMMVWVNKPVIKTPGRLVAEATIDGKKWDVYTNPALSWGYVAFVEQIPTTEGWLDWKKFVDWTRFTGPQHGVWDVGNTCMGAIEIGTETFWGNGTFSLHEFRVTR